MKMRLKRMARLLWRLVIRCAAVVGIMGAAGLLDLGWHWTEAVLEIPFGWLMGMALAAGVVWWLSDGMKRGGTDDDL